MSELRTCPICSSKFSPSRSTIWRGGGQYCSKKCRCAANGPTHSSQANGRPSPTYNSWHTMKQRCQNPSATKYYAYGARGIRVCERWQLFAHFLADMGERPEGTTLDRIDAHGGYEPANCRWATPKEQQAHTSRIHPVSYRGRVYRLSELAALFGIARDTLKGRIQRGWPESDWPKPAGRANRWS